MTDPSTPPNQTTISTPTAPRAVSPSPSPPGLYLPTDRPGNEGFHDRRRRLERLQESIHLDAGQLRDILKRIYRYDHAGRELIWKKKWLDQFVPETFEGAVVTEEVAGEALEEAIDRSLVRLCRPSAYDVYRYAVRLNRNEPGSRKYHIFTVIWDGFTPDVPEELEGLPNLKFNEERRKVFWYPSRN
ncbi:hypothetical protein P170DRAFT_438366 [Aspergillus steynii IBT 23096]|uniref:Uncharacterized protein n=1 Tax=Aspergillus steynii IBT 23096 TaxID=1392250 RepID=A0A2I2G1C3_9EURO|nr:uncharacterized protein P170DRAFT_438366 [Aspergillus steynii IBT 23096]PLB46656.1 hypothetical protein P170DRAFT_438366 [Aspergillus steynii IBT 23096]